MEKTPVIFYEKGILKPRQIAILQEAGYIVLKVDDVNKVKISAPLNTIVIEDEDDGFNLDA
jgi:predicted DNA-binding antitoxin AbrB/MazE fold protein